MTFDLAHSAEQEQLIDITSALFEKQSSPEKVREAEPLGFSPVLWEHVHSMGLTTMSVPEGAGGGGAGLADAALVAGLAGRFLAPAPVVEAIVANRLLAALGSTQAEALLTDAVAGEALLTVALSAAVEGTFRWVPAGALADVVIGQSDGSVMATVDRAPGEALPNLGSLPLAHRSAHGAKTLGDGTKAADAASVARDEWRVLTAGWLTGAARRALEMALVYTTERRAFDTPIASYQSVAHRMADIATVLDGAELLVWKAAWAADRGDARRHELALMAFGFAAETAEAAATESLHFHGGYGFMLEYDAQLYLRRVKALASLGGDPAEELQLLADALWGERITS